MRKLLLTFLAGIFMMPAFAAFIGENDSTNTFLDSLEASFQYQTGDIQLGDDIGTLKVPKGFRYLDPKQAQFVIHDLWGNPGGDGTLGMIVPENMAITNDAWAFIITYDEMGYVKDDDADEIDYDEMLEEIQKEETAINEERVKEGYEAIHMVGWAAKPYYDADKKVLHWAKELQFGDSAEVEHTLNYNVRILGRKGVLVLNAVALVHELPDVQANIDPVLSSFTYADGKKYADFDPDVDEVAAWTIGGLVAGKVLAKAGFFAIILKNIKLIGLGIMALFTGIWKWVKRKTEPPTVRTFGGENNNDAPQA
ncbi:DUF2167 domain-containing protein [Parachryseolinea silvisoli]|uniref:DUF2167 domain-containing protein n=1 Tax=Parachryseolinea silvisoli TaxID=2873601 RepID=UPI002265B109|nr:DUF2167 domain-containing protein [Parachryseolinea silvisoli]MCD9019657.1 DUF2167 domain-containing protein [Parachryseolinea silvisoli]